MVESGSTAPERSGSSETQEESDTSEVDEPVVITPFDQDPLLEHSRGLLIADSDRRSPTVIERSWMAATIQHYARDLGLVREDLRDANRRLDDCKEAGRELDRTVGILRERLRQYARVRHFSQFGASIGAAMAGFGIGEVSAENQILPLLLIVGGLVIVIVAWMTSPKGEDR